MVALLNVCTQYARFLFTNICMYIIFIMAGCVCTNVCITRIMLNQILTGIMISKVQFPNIIIAE